MNLLLLILALLGLWAGTEIAVRQPLRLAATPGLSPIFVGLTILAIGTDLLELVLSKVAFILPGADQSRYGIPNFNCKLGVEHWKLGVGS